MADGGIAAGAGRVPTLDTSCRVDSDCTVKDVGNCCGTFPAGRNPSAIPAATIARAADNDESQQMNLGSHSGWYFAFERYKVSSCQNLDAPESTALFSLVIGPAPTRSASLKVERNIAKFNDIRLIP